MYPPVTANPPTRWLPVTAIMAYLPALAFCAELTLFDTHLHYSASDAGRIDPAAVIGILDRNDVSRAVVTGTPARHAADLFRSLPVPVLYTPGDNEWTDCHRRRAGGFDPRERLTRLRQMFYDESSVLRLDQLGAEAAL